MNGLAIAAIVLGIGVGGLEQVSDFLDAGITLSGRPTFRRNLEGGTSTFEISSGDGVLLIRVVDKYAFGQERKSGISGSWSKALTTGQFATFRLADPVASGTVADDRLLDRIAMCLPRGGGLALDSRTKTSGFFAFRCVAFKETEQVKEDGALIFEIDLVVTARNESVVDRFLSRDRTILYVRLE